jgi:hypothetical protein
MGNEKYNKILIGNLEGTRKFLDTSRQTGMI